MRIKRSININLRLTDREKAMIDALATYYGGVSSSEVLRRTLAERFNKAFPAYTKKISGAGIPDEELSQEQICEMLGGKVTKDASGPVCEFPHGTMKKRVPLTMMGQVGITGDYRVKR